MGPPMQLTVHSNLCYTGGAEYFLRCSGKQNRFARRRFAKTQGIIHAALARKDG